MCNAHKYQHTFCSGGQKNFQPIGEARICFFSLLRSAPATFWLHLFPLPASSTLYPPRLSPLQLPARGAMLLCTSMPSLTRAYSLVPILYPFCYTWLYSWDSMSIRSGVRFGLWARVCKPLDWVSRGQETHFIHLGYFQHPTQCLIHHRSSSRVHFTNHCISLTDYTDSPSGVS